MKDLLPRVVSALGAIRTPAEPGEYDLHALVAAALRAADLPARHEVPLAPRCRVDFLVDTVGIEVKKGRPAPARLREQLSRYVASDALTALVVVTQRAVPLPETLGGKRVVQVSLNRLWGVALP